MSRNKLGGTAGTQYTITIVWTKRHNPGLPLQGAKLYPLVCIPLNWPTYSGALRPPVPGIAAAGEQSDAGVFVISL